MFDVQFGAELVELMFPALRALAQAKETVGELLAIVCEYGSDAQWVWLRSCTLSRLRHFQTVCSVVPNRSARTQAGSSLA